MRSIALCIISILLSVYSFTQVGTLNYSFRTFPQVGVLVSNVSGTSNKARVAKDTLGSLYNRFTAIPMISWGGTSAALTTFNNAGLISHVVIDVGSSGSSPDGWITNSTSFTLTNLADTVEYLLSNHPEIQILVLDNEEINTAYHTGNLAQYDSIAEVVQPICRLHHVLLMNGGFGNFFAINGYVFRWIKSNYTQARADTFATYAFTNGMAGSQYSAANTPGSNPTLDAEIDQVDTVVSSGYFDILNVHFYNPPPGKIATFDTATYAYQPQIWQYYKQCFSNANANHRRQVACNETGQRGNSNADLVTNMLNMAWQLRFIVFDWWSGNGVSLSAEPLTEDDGTNKPNGEAYKSFSTIYSGLPAP